MEIRKATLEDLDEIMDLFEQAREFMKEQGNPAQWALSKYPPKEVLIEDIEKGRSYVCDDYGLILASFMYEFGRDKNYDYIEGSWDNDDAFYGIVHRITTRRGTVGIGSYCLDWAYNASGNLRIDTHEDNVPMKNLLQKLGFIRRGIVYMEDGSKRIGFSKTKAVRF